MLAFKGFTGKLTATYGKGTYQYEEGKTYTEEKSKTRTTGFHCAEYILDCMTWYKMDGRNRFFAVEAAGSIDEEEGMDLKAMQEILAPDGEKVYSIRIQGHGRIMLIMKDTENEITVFKVRSNEKERYDWNNAKYYVDAIISEKTAKERWEELYQETFPEKEEIAPVQQTKQRKESKVKRAKVPEKPKTKPRNIKENAKKQEAMENLPIAAVTKKEEIAPVQQTEEVLNAEQIEGQMNVADYPELMPERTEHVQIQTADEIITRKEYLDNLTEYGAAEYLCKHLKPEVLENKETMEEWLKAEVDKKWGMEVEHA